MVTPVPTFNSNKTITPVGAISFNGTRAMAGAFGDVGKVFDQIGAFAERKLNEQVEREQTILGQDIARSKGFDPNTLPDPRTMADKIYRESALNTYAIQIENDVSTHINDLFITNYRNPSGFAASADAYVTKTVDALPPELKNGVSKLAMSMATQRHFQLLSEQQRRVLAEQEAGEKSYLAKLADQIILEKSPEQRQVLMAKLDSTIDKSTSYITSEGKAAAKRELLDKIFFNDTFNKVTNAELTPAEAIKNLQELGIVPNSEMISQIYSTANQRLEFADEAVKRQKVQRAQKLEAIADEGMMAIYDLAEAGEASEFFKIRQQMTIQNMRYNGATAKEIFDFKANSTKLFFGETKDNPEVVAFLQSLSFDADPTTLTHVNEAFAKGQITAVTRQNFYEDYTGRRAQIRNNPELQSYLNNEYIPKYAPLATISEELAISPSASTRFKELVAADKDKQRAAIDWVVNRSKEVGMSAAIQEFSSNVRANQTPVSAEHILEKYSGQPIYAKIEREYKSPNFILKTVSNEGRVISLGYDTAPPEKKEIMKGPWTRENGVARVRLMREQQKKAAAFGIDLYDEDFLKNIYEDWK